MFWRFQEIENGKDKYGRTYEEARREYALWCLKTFFDNVENDQLAEEYLHKHCASWISRSDEDAKFFNSDAALNAYYEIKTEFKEFKQYYPEETILHFKKNGWN